MKNLRAVVVVECNIACEHEVRDRREVGGKKKLKELGQERRSRHSGRPRSKTYEGA